MITAALHATPVSPTIQRSEGQTAELARIASEIAERLEEMDALRLGSGMDMVNRLATVARVDASSYKMAIAILHGDLSPLLDSYAAQGEKAGRKKQTMHYRTLQSIEHLRRIFPEAADIIDQYRLSVKHHEDPVSREEIIRDATR